MDTSRSRLSAWARFNDVLNQRAETGLSLVYRPKPRHGRSQSLPGPAYDLIVWGLLFIIGGSYIVAKLWTS